MIHIHPLKKKKYVKIVVNHSQVTFHNQDFVLYHAETNIEEIIKNINNCKIIWSKHEKKYRRYLDQIYQSCL
jgi:DNA polymerase II small subunit/DNA polymerase delta subunit B